MLTPQLTQAIKLLQLSNLELEAFIAEELSKNPLLEARPATKPTSSPARPISAETMSTATKRRTIRAPTT